MTVEKLSFMTHWMTLMAAGKDAEQGSPLELFLLSHFRIDSGEDARAVRSTSFLMSSSA